MKAVALVALAAALLVGTAAGGTPKKPWLWQCEQIHLEQAKDACYVRLLLLDINRSGDPATELPRIDARAKAQPTSLYARCHMLMHVVGRQWAKQHHLSYPIAFDGDKSASRRYGVEGLPTLVVISKTGKVIATRTGVTDGEELERLVNQAL